MFAPGLTLTPLQSGVLGLIVSLALYRALTLVYYRSLHPLARFPGPLKAATSRRWIYDLSFPEEDLERLHEQYNTRALRIGPDELHITDIEQYKVIYSQSHPFPKHEPFYQVFNSHTLFTEIDISKHKERRRLLNPAFARSEVFKLEPVIYEKLSILGRKIRRLENSHYINLYDAFRCLTTEVIMDFAFARSANMLEESQSSFQSWFLDAFDVASQTVWRTQGFPLIRTILRRLPVSMITLLNPKIASTLKLRSFAASCLDFYNKNGNTTSHPVIFDRLGSLSDSQKASESSDILVAGADTTASTLTCAIMNILSNPDIHSKLSTALADITSNGGDDKEFTLLELEKINYLTACVKESLRVGMAVPGRLPRVVPSNLPQPLVVDGEVIPPGTVVSMSAYTMHTSEKIWGSDAREFNPDRWLKTDSRSLDQYLCTFSRGTRMCIGQNVATAEITIVLAYLFSNFNLSLPSDYAPPRREDLFTLQYAKPGLPIKMSSILKDYPQP